MTLFTPWLISSALVAIAYSLAQILKGLGQIMAGLDDIKAGQAKERALIEKLLGLVQGAPAGTFTPEQQAEIDGIVADQAATLAEDTTTQA